MGDNNNFMGSTVAVAVTAVFFSPRVRGMLRSGAVQGLAGALIAGDAISSFARGIGRGLQAGNAGDPTTKTAQEAAQAAQGAAKAATEAAPSAAKPRASTRTPRKAAKRAAPAKRGKSES